MVCVWVCVRCNQALAKLLQPQSGNNKTITIIFIGPEANKTIPPSDRLFAQQLVDFLVSTAGGTTEALEALRQRLNFLLRSSGMVVSQGHGHLL